MLVLGDAHATTPARRAALLAAYRAYDGVTDGVEPSDTEEDDGGDEADESGRPVEGGEPGGDTGPDAALQLGDLEHYDLPSPTWFVAGNNEDFDVVDALRAGRRPDGVRNATLLAGTVVELSGLRIAGLSGNHAPTQYEKSRAELSGERRRHFVRDDVEQVAALDDVDVLLTHEAPSRFIYYGYDAGCEHVTDLLERLQPALCLVGHHHAHTEGEIAGVRTVSLAPVWERYYALDTEDLTLSSYPTPGDAREPE